MSPNDRPHAWAAALLASLLGIATAPDAAAQKFVPGGPGGGRTVTVDGGQADGPLAQPTGPCVWTTVEENPIPRIEAASVTVNGRVHVLGGFTSTQLLASSRHDVFDPASQKWSSLADLPQPVTHAGFTASATSIWIAGGFLGDHPGPVVSNVFRYDLATDTWTSLPSLPVPRGSGALVLRGNVLHWFGGVGPNKEVDKGEHWVHVLGGTNWQPRAPLPTPRNHLGGAQLGGKVYAIGGQNRHDDNPSDLKVVHRYDPASNTWTQVANLPYSRSHFEPGTFVHEGRIIIAGGRANQIGLAAVPDVTAYDPATDTWTQLVPLPAALLAPTARMADGVLFVSGGGPGPFAPSAASHVRDLDVGLPATQRINAGGGNFFAPVGRGPSGWTFRSPSAWFCSDVWSTSGTAFNAPDGLEIADTEADALYRSERTGSDADPDRLTYSIPVASGAWRVRLHFAEIYWGAPGGGPGGAGRRVFDILVEDDVVLEDLDIYAQVGAAAALVCTFDVTVLDGRLDIELDASVDRPKISAIEILPAGS